MTNKPTTSRPARNGEICSCGDPATVVYHTSTFGDVPWCGREYDDGQITGLAAALGEQTAELCAEILDLREEQENRA